MTNWLDYSYNKILLVNFLDISEIWGSLSRHNSKQHILKTKYAIISKRPCLTRDINILKKWTSNSYNVYQKNETSILCDLNYKVQNIMYGFSIVYV